MDHYRHINTSELEGCVIASVTRTGDEVLELTDTSGYRYRMFHEQDCCEFVYIERVDGELNDLVDQEILSATVITTHSEHDSGDTQTNTTFCFFTLNDPVIIHWQGTSNGYYHEGVSLIKYEKQ